MSDRKRNEISAESMARTIAIQANQLLECFQPGEEYDTVQVGAELSDVMRHCRQMYAGLGLDESETAERRAAEQRENISCIQAGAAILRPCVSAFCAAEMRAVYGDNWWQETMASVSERGTLPVMGSDGEKIAALGVRNCLQLIDKKWDAVFSGKLGEINGRAAAKELLRAEKLVRAGGMQDVEKEDVEATLDAMARLCGVISPDTVQQLRALADENAEIPAESHPSASPEVPKENDSVFEAAECSPDLPLVFCASAGAAITRFFARPRFAALRWTEQSADSRTCRAFFVNDTGRVISDVREFTVQTGTETAVNISLKPESMKLDSCRLVLQDAGEHGGAALQVVPFALRIQSVFER